MEWRCSCSMMSGFVGPAFLVFGNSVVIAAVAGHVRLDWLYHHYLPGSRRNSEISILY